MKKKLNIMFVIFYGIKNDSDIIVYIEWMEKFV